MACWVNKAKTQTLRERRSETNLVSLNAFCNKAVLLKELSHSSSILLDKYPFFFSEFLENQSFGTAE